MKRERLTGKRRFHLITAAPLVLLIATLATALSGCQHNHTKTADDDSVIPRYTMHELRREVDKVKPNDSNIDFSEADIIIPQADEIEELIFPLDGNIAKSKDAYEKIKNNFYENIRLLTGKNDIKEQHICYKLPLDAEPIPINEVKEEDRKRSADSMAGDPKQGFYLSYHDPACSMLLYGSSFMLEMANSRIAEHSEKRDDWLGHRPPEGITIESFDLPKDPIDTVSYLVGGRQLALTEAVTYVEENMGKGYHYVRSPYLSYQVSHVDVVKLKEDRYYYQMKLRALYQGIPFSYDDYANILPAKGEEVEYENFSTTHTVVMMAENSIDYIWSCAHSYEAKKDGEIYTRFISIQDAMDILSRTVSAAAKLKCDTIEFLYRTEFHKDADGEIKEVQCHPVYQFKFTDTGLPEYPVLFFNVDAVNGLVEASNA